MYYWSTNVQLTTVSGLYSGVGSEDKAELNRLMQQTKLSSQPELCSNSSHQHSISAGLKAGINFRQKFTGRLWVDCFSAMY